IDPGDLGRIFVIERDRLDGDRVAYLEDSREQRALEGQHLPSVGGRAFWEDRQPPPFESAPHLFDLPGDCAAPLSGNEYGVVLIAQPLQKRVSGQPTLSDERGAAGAGKGEDVEPAHVVRDKQQLARSDIAPDADTQPGNPSN